MVLADEINRTTPKTQSALLEAMSEGKVTVEDQSYALPAPFVVVATQNPVEHHGTYPLPILSLTGFSCASGWATRRLRTRSRSSVRRSVMRRRIISQPAVSAEDILRAQKAIDSVSVHEALLDYIMTLAQATRSSDAITVGVSPRGTMSLYRAAQALAFLQGRELCVPDDVKRLVIPVFSHRVMVSSKYSSPLSRTHEAEAVIQTLMDQVEVPL